MFLQYHIIFFSMCHYRIFLELWKLKSRCCLPIAGKMEQNLFLSFSKVRHPILAVFYSENNQQFADFLFSQEWIQNEGSKLARAQNVAECSRGSTCLFGRFNSICCGHVGQFNFRFRKKNEKKRPEFVAPQGMPV